MLPGSKTDIVSLQNVLLSMHTSLVFKRRLCWPCTDISFTVEETMSSCQRGRLMLSFSRNKFPLPSKKLLNCIKWRGATVDCVHTTMFPLQATVCFSNNRAVFNGCVFAREVWSCFPLLDHEERWRASINSSSYRGHYAEAIRAALCPRVSAFVDGIIFHCAVLCFAASSFPSLLRCVFDFDMLSHDCL